MQLILVCLTRLLGLFYKLRPVLSSLLFTVLLSLSVWTEASFAQAKRFTIQIASCPTKQEAEGIAAQLLQRGVKAEVSMIEPPGHGEVFRVRAGKFVSPAAAREAGEQWKAANWIQSYWVARDELFTSSQISLATDAANSKTRRRVVSPEKLLPEMGLGELIQALSDKWTVRVPENLKLFSAAVVFPQTGVIRPAVVLMDEARLRTLSSPTLKRRDILHPLDLRFEPGVKNSPADNSLRFTESERLLASLRSISGYRDLSFDERGILVLGERIEGGSDLARLLLRAAVESREAIEIESLEGSDLVVFGAFMNARFTNAEKKKNRVNKIQLDFHDFDQLRGDPRLIESFDPGFVFLHELAHGVWDLPDDEKGGLGECETFINQIRRQLGLPERLSYFYKIRRQFGGVEFGEMMFVQPSNGVRRRQALKLQWDNRAVNNAIKPPNAAPVSGTSGIQPQ